ncbi:unnamed protein product [Blepharisma stoltei]|uniref:RING-type domain-containing protein n=1 Tax=Blepharisma stoltei TaxID=1481888 RepID=A0AAU9JTL7_9CILI|nr:unnamed protein product [Blepharisma stoltei]
MNWAQRLSLFGSIGSIIIYNCLLLCYLFAAKFKEPILKFCGLAFFSLSCMTNPIMLTLATKDGSTFSSQKYTLRLLLFFPLSIILSNTFLALNPIIMQKLMLLIGVTDFSKIIYSIFYLYIGKLCSTGILDVFCQFFIVGSNLEGEGFSIEEPQIYLFALLITSIILIFLSLCCCTDVIRAYIEQYQTLANIREKLIPKIWIYSSEMKEEMCAICLDAFNIGQRIGILMSCNHIFHENCLGKWLSYKEACPVCRKEGAVESN